MMQTSPSARIRMTLAPDSFYIPLRVTEWCETTGDDALEAAAPLFRILIVSRRERNAPHQRGLA